MKMGHTFVDKLLMTDFKISLCKILLIKMGETQWKYVGTCDSTWQNTNKQHILFDFFFWKLGCLYPVQSCMYIIRFLVGYLQISEYLFKFGLNLSCYNFLYALQKFIGIVYFTDIGLWWVWWFKNALTCGLVSQCLRKIWSWNHRQPSKWMHLHLYYWTIRFSPIFSAEQ